MSDTRIYVASLTDYNAGTLYGKWIDVEGLDADDIHEEVQEMLKGSPEAKAFPQGGPAEEWAIHDYEGFGSYKLSEWESFTTIAVLAEGITEHGEAFSAWLENCNGDIENPERFEEQYQGEWDSFKDYVYEFIESTGMLKDMPEHLENYFDYDAYARDMEAEYTVVKTPDYKVWVFEDNA